MAEESEAKPERDGVGGLLGLLVVLALVFAGGRMFVERGANAPVEDNLAAYLNELAAHSKHAARYLDRYYTKYSRHTVAGVHFEAVCGAVTALAEADGFDPESVSPDTAFLCRRARFRPKGEVPDLEEGTRI